MVKHKKQHRNKSKSLIKNALLNKEKFIRLAKVIFVAIPLAFLLLTIYGQSKQFLAVKFFRNTGKQTPSIYRMDPGTGGSGGGATPAPAPTPNPTPVVVAPDTPQEHNPSNSGGGSNSGSGTGTPSHNSGHTSSNHDGDTRCKNNSVEVYFSHKWQRDENCSYGCSDGKCKSKPVVVNPDTPQEHNPSNSGGGSNSGSGTGTPSHNSGHTPSTNSDGDARCKNNNVEVYFSHKWQLDEACSYGCSASKCKSKPYSANTQTGIPQAPSPLSPPLPPYLRHPTPLVVAPDQPSHSGSNQQTTRDDQFEQLATLANLSPGGINGSTIEPCPKPTILLMQPEFKSLPIYKKIYYVTTNWILRNIFHAPKTLEIFYTEGQIAAKPCNPAILPTDPAAQSGQSMADNLNGSNNHQETIEVDKKTQITDTTNAQTNTTTEQDLQWAKAYNAAHSGETQLCTGDNDPSDCKDLNTPFAQARIQERDQAQQLSSHGQDVNWDQIAQSDNSIPSSACDIHKSDPDNYANCMQAITNCGASCVNLSYDSENNPIVTSINWGENTTYGMIVDTKNDQDTLENFQKYVVDKCKSEVPGADCDNPDTAAQAHDKRYGTNMAGSLENMRNIAVAKEVAEKDGIKPNELFSKHPDIVKYVPWAKLSAACSVLGIPDDECAKIENTQATIDLAEKDPNFKDFFGRILGNLVAPELAKQQPENINLSDLELEKTGDVYTLNGAEGLEIKPCNDDYRDIQEGSDRDEKGNQHWCLFTSEDKFDLGPNAEQLLKNGENPLTALEKEGENNQKLKSQLSNITRAETGDDSLNAYNNFDNPNLISSSSKIGDLYTIKYGGESYIYDSKNSVLRSKKTGLKIDLPANAIVEAPDSSKVALSKSALSTFKVQDRTILDNIIDWTKKQYRNNLSKAQENNGNGNKSLSWQNIALLRKAREGMASLGKFIGITKNSQNHSDQALMNKINSTTAKENIQYEGKNYLIYKNEDGTSNVCSTSNKNICVQTFVSQFGVAKSVMADLEKQERLTKANTTQKKSWFSAYKDAVIANNSNDNSDNNYTTLRDKLNSLGEDFEITNFDKINNIATVESPNGLQYTIDTKNLAKNGKLDFGTIREIQLSEGLANNDSISNRDLAETINLHQSIQSLTSGQSSQNEQFSVRTNENGIVEILNSSHHQVSSMSPQQAAIYIRNHQRKDDRANQNMVNNLRETSKNIDEIYQKLDVLPDSGIDAETEITDDNRVTEANILLTQLTSELNKRSGNDGEFSMDGFSVSMNPDNGQIIITSSGDSTTPITYLDQKTAVLYITNPDNISDGFISQLNQIKDVALNQGVLLADIPKNMGAGMSYKPISEIAAEMGIVMIVNSIDGSETNVPFIWKNGKWVNKINGEEYDVNRFKSEYDEISAKTITDGNGNYIKADSPLADNPIYNIDSESISVTDSEDVANRWESIVLKSDLQDHIVSFGNTPNIHYIIKGSDDNGNLQVVALGDSSQQILTYDPSIDGDIKLITNNGEPLKYNGERSVQLTLGGMENFESAATNLIPDNLKKAVVGDRDDFDKQYQAYRDNKKSLINILKGTQYSGGQEKTINDVMQDAANGDVDFVSLSTIINGTDKPWGERALTKVAVGYNNLTSGRMVRGEVLRNKEGATFMDKARGGIMEAGDAAAATLLLASGGIIGLSAYAGTGSIVAAAGQTGIAMGFSMGAQGMTQAAEYCDSWNDIRQGMHLNKIFTQTKEGKCAQGVANASISVLGSASALFREFATARQGLQAVAEAGMVGTAAENVTVAATGLQKTSRAVDLVFNGTSTAWFGGQAVSTCKEKVDINCVIMTGAAIGAAGRTAGALSETSTIASKANIADSGGDILNTFTSCIGAGFSVIGRNTTTLGEQAKQCLQSLPQALTAPATLGVHKSNFINRLTGKPTQAEGIAVNTKEGILKPLEESLIVTEANGVAKIKTSDGEVITFNLKDSNQFSAIRERYRSEEFQNAFAKISTDNSNSQLRNQIAHEIAQTEKAAKALEQLNIKPSDFGVEKFEQLNTEVLITAYNLKQQTEMVSKILPEETAQKLQSQTNELLSKLGETDSNIAMVKIAETTSQVAQTQQKFVSTKPQEFFDQLIKEYPDMVTEHIVNKDAQGLHDQLTSLGIKPNDATNIVNKTIDPNFTIANESKPRLALRKNPKNNSPPETAQTEIVAKLQKAAGTSDFDVVLNRIQLDYNINKNHPAIKAITEYHNALTDLANLKTPQNISETQTKITETQQGLVKARQELAKLENDLAKAQRQNPTKRNAKTNLNKKISELKANIDGKNTSISSRTENLNKLQTDLDGLISQNKTKIAKTIQSLDPIKSTNAFQELNTLVTTKDPTQITNLRNSEVLTDLIKQQGEQLNLKTGETIPGAKIEQLRNLSEAIGKHYPEVAKEMDALITNINKNPEINSASRFRYIKNELNRVTELAKNASKPPTPPNTLTRIKDAFNGNIRVSLPESGEITLRPGMEIEFNGENGKQVVKIEKGLKINGIEIEDSAISIKIDGDKMLSITSKNGEVVNKDPQNATLITKNPERITLASIIKSPKESWNKIFKPSFADLNSQLIKQDLRVLATKIGDPTQLVTARVYEMNKLPENLRSGDESFLRTVKDDLAKASNQQKEYTFGKSKFTFELKDGQVYLINAKRNPNDTTIHFQTEPSFNIQELQKRANLSGREVELLEKTNHIMRAFENTMSKENGFDFKLFGQEAGVKNQAQLIAEALLKPNGALIEAITGSGKSAVHTPFLTLSEKYLYDNNSLQIFKSENDLNNAKSQFSDQMYSEIFQELFGRKPKIVDITESTKLSDILDADIARGDTSTFYKFVDANAAKGAKAHARLVEEFTQNRTLIADEGHITLGLTEYIISAGEPKFVKDMQIGSETPIEALGSVVDLESFKVSDLNYNNRQSKIDDLGISQDKKGTVTFRNKEYVDIAEEIIKNIKSDNPSETESAFIAKFEKVKGNPREARKLIAEFKDSQDLASSQFRDKLNNRLTAVHKVAETLFKTPGNDYGLRDGMMVLKEGAIETGRKLSNPYDALAQEYVGKKVYGQDPNLDNVTVQSKSIGGTNASKVQALFERTYTYSGTVSQVTEQLKLYGLDLVKSPDFDPAKMVFGTDAGHPVSKYHKVDSVTGDNAVQAVKDSFVSKKESQIVVANKEASEAEILSLAKNKGDEFITITNAEGKNKLYAKNDNGEYKEVTIDEHSLRDPEIIQKLQEQDFDTAKLENLDSRHIMNEIFSQLRDKNKSFTHVFAYGTHYGTDYDIRGKLVVVAGDTTTATEFYQAIGRDRAKGGNFLDLDVLYVGKDIAKNSTQKGEFADAFKEKITENDQAVAQQRTFDTVEKSINDLVNTATTNLIKANAQKSGFFGPNDRLKSIAAEIQAKLDAQSWIDYNPNPEKISTEQALQDTIARKQEFVRSIIAEYEGQNIRGLEEFKKAVLLDDGEKISLKGNPSTSQEESSIPAINRTSSLNELVKYVNENVSKEILPADIVRDGFKKPETTFDIASVVKLNDPAKTQTQIEALAKQQLGLKGAENIPNAVQSAIKAVITSQRISLLAQELDKGNKITGNIGFKANNNAKWTINLDDSGNLDFIHRKNSDDTEIIFSKVNLEALNRDGYLILEAENNDSTDINYSTDSLLIYLKNGNLYARTMEDIADIVNRTNAGHLFAPQSSLQTQLDVDTQKLQNAIAKAKGGEVQQQPPINKKANIPQTPSLWQKISNNWSSIKNINPLPFLQTKLSSLWHSKNKPATKQNSTAKQIYSRNDLKDIFRDMAKNPNAQPDSLTTYLDSVENHPTLSYLFTRLENVYKKRSQYPKGTDEYKSFDPQLEDIKRQIYEANDQWQKDPKKLDTITVPQAQITANIDKIPLPLTFADNKTDGPFRISLPDAVNNIFITNSESDVSARTITRSGVKATYLKNGDIMDIDGTKYTVSITKDILEIKNDTGEVVFGTKYSDSGFLVEKQIKNGNVNSVTTPEVQIQNISDQFTKEIENINNVISKDKNSSRINPQLTLESIRDTMVSIVNMQFELNTLKDNHLELFSEINTLLDKMNTEYESLKTQHNQIQSKISQGLSPIAQFKNWFTNLLDYNRQLNSAQNPNPKTAGLDNPPSQTPPDQQKLDFNEAIKLSQQMNFDKLPNEVVSAAKSYQKAYKEWRIANQNSSPTAESQRTIAENNLDKAKQRLKTVIDQYNNPQKSSFSRISNLFASTKTKLASLPSAWLTNLQAPKLSNEFEPIKNIQFEIDKKGKVTIRNNSAYKIFANDSKLDKVIYKRESLELSTNKTTIEINGQKYTIDKSNQQISIIDDDNSDQVESRQIESNKFSKQSKPSFLVNLLLNILNNTTATKATKLEPGDPNNCLTPLNVSADASSQANLPMMAPMEPIQDGQIPEVYIQQGGGGGGTCFAKTEILLGGVGKLRIALSDKGVEYEHNGKMFVSSASGENGKYKDYTTSAELIIDGTRYLILYNIGNLQFRLYKKESLFIQNRLDLVMQGMFSGIFRDNLLTVTEIKNYLSPKKAQQIFRDSEIHNGNKPSSKSLKKIISRNGLLPKTRITLSNGNQNYQYYISNPYIIDKTRSAFLVYVVENGRMTIRSYYKSGSHSQWKYLPGYTLDTNGTVKWFSKGKDSNSIAVPQPLSRYLDEINNNRGQLILKSTEANDIFISTARPLKSKHQSKDPNAYTSADNENSVVSPSLSMTNETGNSLGIPSLYWFKKRGISVDPKMIKPYLEENEPDFSRIIETWTETGNDVYGDIKHTVFLSKNGHFKYIFHQGPKGLVWINVYYARTRIVAAGLPEKYIDPGLLNVPGYEYKTQSFGFGGETHKKYSYVNMSRFLDEIPMIKSYKSIFIDREGFYGNNTPQQTSQSKIAQSLTFSGSGGGITFTKEEIASLIEALEREKNEEITSLKQYGVSYKVPPAKTAFNTLIAAIENGTQIDFRPSSVLNNYFGKTTRIYGFLTEEANSPEIKKLLTFLNNNKEIITLEQSQTQSSNIAQQSTATPKNDAVVITIGRNADTVTNNVNLMDNATSRQHAQITLEGGRFSIKDLGSNNGTHVNGDRISLKTELKNGDKIRIGTNVLMVSINNGKFTLTDQQGAEVYSREFAQQNTAKNPEAKIQPTQAQTNNTTPHQGNSVDSTPVTADTTQQPSVSNAQSTTPKTQTATPLLALPAPLPELSSTNIQYESKGSEVTLYADPDATVTLNGKGIKPTNGRFEFSFKNPMSQRANLENLSSSLVIQQGDKVFAGQFDNNGKYTPTNLSNLQKNWILGNTHLVGTMKDILGIFGKYNFDSKSQKAVVNRITSGRLVPYVIDHNNNPAILILHNPNGKTTIKFTEAFYGLDRSEQAPLLRKASNILDDLHSNIDVKTQARISKAMITILDTTEGALFPTLRNISNYLTGNPIFTQNIQNAKTFESFLTAFGRYGQFLNYEQKPQMHKFGASLLEGEIRLAENDLEKLLFLKQMISNHSDILGNYFINDTSLEETIANLITKTSQSLDPDLSPVNPQARRAAIATLANKITLANYQRDNAINAVDTFTNSNLPRHILEIQSSIDQYMAAITNNDPDGQNQYRNSVKNSIDELLRGIRHIDETTAGNNSLDIQLNDLYISIYDRIGADTTPGQTNLQSLKGYFDELEHPDSQLMAFLDAKRAQINDFYNSQITQLQKQAQTSSQQATDPQQSKPQSNPTSAVDTVGDGTVNNNPAANTVAAQPSPTQASIITSTPAEEFAAIVNNHQERFNLLTEGLKTANEAKTSTILRELVNLKDHLINLKSTSPDLFKDNPQATRLYADLSQQIANLNQHIISKQEKAVNDMNKAIGIVFEKIIENDPVARLVFQALWAGPRRTMNVQAPASTTALLLLPDFTKNAEMKLNKFKDQLLTENPQDLNITQARNDLNQITIYLKENVSSTQDKKPLRIMVSDLSIYLDTVEKIITEAKNESPDFSTIYSSYGDMSNRELKGQLNKLVEQLMDQKIKTQADNLDAQIKLFLGYANVFKISQNGRNFSITTPSTDTDTQVELAIYLYQEIDRFIEKLKVIDTENTQHDERIVLLNRKKEEIARALAIQFKLDVYNNTLTTRNFGDKIDLTAIQNFLQRQADKSILSQQNGDPCLTGSTTTAQATPDSSLSMMAPMEPARELEIYNAGGCDPKQYTPVATLGRGGNNSIQISDGKVSTNHLIFVRKNVKDQFGEIGDIILVDQGSTNGTYVNGQKLSQFNLSDYLRIYYRAPSIQIGDTRFGFYIQSNGQPVIHHLDKNDQYMGTPQNIGEITDTNKSTIWGRVVGFFKKIFSVSKTPTKIGSKFENPYGDQGSPRITKMFQDQRTNDSPLTLDELNIIYNFTNKAISLIKAKQYAQAKETLRDLGVINQLRITLDNVDNISLNNLADINTTKSSIEIVASNARTIDQNKSLRLPRLPYFGQNNNIQRQIDHELSLIYLEEWLHILQMEARGLVDNISPADSIGLENDVAQYMQQQGIQLTDAFYSRYERESLRNNQPPKHPR